ncbi:hypothetical protein [Streptomyces mutabilis]|uniref:hypothetical protein n=1 Tax=Streptomyces mutabilis TaxID=67332 RepID=UPI0034182809
MSRRNQTPGDFAAIMINDVRDNLAQAPTVRGAETLAAFSVAGAQLAIAAALLDVADAICSCDPGPAVERAMDRMTVAVCDGAGRREA